MGILSQSPLLSPPPPPANLLLMLLLTAVGKGERSREGGGEGGFFFERGEWRVAPSTLVKVVSARVRRLRLLRGRGTPAARHATRHAAALAAEAGRHALASHARHSTHATHVRHAALASHSGHASHAAHATHTAHHALHEGSDLRVAHVLHDRLGLSGHHVRVRHHRLDLRVVHVRHARHASLAALAAALAAEREAALASHACHGLLGLLALPTDLLLALLPQHVLLLLQLADAALLRDARHRHVVVADLLRLRLHGLQQLRLVRVEVHLVRLVQVVRGLDPLPDLAVRLPAHAQRLGLVGVERDGGGGVADGAVRLLPLQVALGAEGPDGGHVRVELEGVGEEPDGLLELALLHDSDGLAAQLHRLVGVGLLDHLLRRHGGVDGVRVVLFDALVVLARVGRELGVEDRLLLLHRLLLLLLLLVVVLLVLRLVLLVHLHLVRVLALPLLLLLALVRLRRRRQHDLRPLLVLLALLLVLLLRHVVQRRRRVRAERVLRHLQRLVQGNNGRRLQRQTEHEHEGVPVPVLHEHVQTHDRLDQVVPVLVQADGLVLATGVEDADGKHGAELGQNLLVLVLDALLDVLTELLHPRDLLLRPLHQNHRNRHNSTLPHEVRRVVLQHPQTVKRLLVRRPCSSNAERGGHAPPDVRRVRVREDGRHVDAETGLLEGHEADLHDARAAHVVARVLHSHRQQALDRLAVAGARVGGADHLHAAEPEPRVGRGEEVLDERVGVALPAVHERRKGDGHTADDLLVLRVLPVPQQLLHDVRLAAAEVQQADGHRGRLRGHGVVAEQNLLQEIVDARVLRRHGGKADAEARSVQQLLRLLIRLHALDEEVQHLLRACLLVVRGTGRTGGHKGSGVLPQVAPDRRVDQAEPVQRATLLVGVGAARTRGRGKAVLQHLHALGDVPLVDDARARRGGELGPVGRRADPLRVVLRELVLRSAAEHDGVGHDGGGLRDGVLLRVDRLLHLVHCLDGAVAVRVEELELQLGAGCARQDRRKAAVVLRHLGSLLAAFALCLEVVAHAVSHGQQEVLVAVLHKVEGKLEGNEVGVLGLRVEEHEQVPAHLLCVVQEDEALLHVEMVQRPQLLGRLLVQLHHAPQQAFAHVNVVDEAVREAEDARQHVGLQRLLHVLLRHVLQHVEALRRDAQPDVLRDEGVVVVVLHPRAHQRREQLVELRVLLVGLAVLLLQLAQLHVPVHTLPHDGVGELVALRHVEHLARTQRKDQGIVVLPQVVVHPAEEQCRLLPLGKVRGLVQLLDGTEGTGDLVPELVHTRKKRGDGARLQALVLLLQQGEQPLDARHGRHCPCRLATPFSTQASGFGRCVRTAPYGFNEVQIL
eukprot:Rhum_TRINITY_DN15333_c5_g3::Rhum_TRINITY_DN15333_c5_g3_i1::g.152412::m.152412